LRQISKFGGDKIGDGDLASAARGHWASFEDYIEAYNVSNYKVICDLFKSTLISKARTWFDTISRPKDLASLKAEFLGRYDRGLESRHSASATLYAFKKRKDESWAEAAVRLKSLNTVLRYSDEALMDRFLHLLDGSSRVLLRARMGNSFSEFLDALRELDKDHVLCPSEKDEYQAGGTHVTQEVGELAMSVAALQEKVLSMYESNTKHLEQIESQLQKRNAPRRPQSRPGTPVFGQPAVQWMAPEMTQPAVQPQPVMQREGPPSRPQSPRVTWSDYPQQQVTQDARINQPHTAPSQRPQMSYQTNQSPSPMSQGYYRPSQDARVNQSTSPSPQGYYQTPQRGPTNWQGGYVANRSAVRAPYPGPPQLNYGQGTGGYPQQRIPGCWLCGDLSHIKRECPYYVPRSYNPPADGMYSAEEGMWDISGDNGNTGHGHNMAVFQ
jgi:hypothetical protein